MYNLTLSWYLGITLTINRACNHLRGRVETCKDTIAEKSSTANLWWQWLYASFIAFQICKHFLDALENSKYGWFWECPGGPKCHYKHAVPPGKILSYFAQFALCTILTPFAHFSCYRHVVNWIFLDGIRCFVVTF